MYCYAEIDRISLQGKEKLGKKGRKMKRSIIKVVLSTALLTSVGFSSDLVLSGAKVKFAKKLSLHQLNSSSIEQSDVTVIIHTEKSLSKDDMDRLYKNGAKAVEYAGINSYYLVGSVDSIEEIVENSKSIKGVALLKPEYKIKSDLKNISINDEVKVKLTFLKDIDKASLEKLLNQNGVDYKDLKQNHDFAMAELTIYGIDIERVASIALVKEIGKFHKIGLIKPFSTKISAKDLDTANTTHASNLWNNNTGLDGLNIPVAIVDEGRVLTSHTEFKVGQATRIRDKVANGSLSLHSTHVAGIIGARGYNHDAKGMAESTQIFSFCYQDYYFASSISSLASRFNILVSNHSYGFTDKSDLGVYNSDAASEDSVVYNNPYINVFMAAGNDRSFDGYADTGIIKGAANAKNIFTIGALNSSSSDVAYYSSTGPVNDYRIKPDLCIKGSSVFSTSSSGGYAYMTGTSMATPAATGLATLVMQEYKDITDCGQGVGCDMRHDLLKAILINTAIDKNNPGPDVYTGYGMINVEEAVNDVKTIENSMKKIKLDKVGRNAIKEYKFSINSNTDFDTTVSWVDPAGNSANSGKTLVNDIDMYLVNTDNNKKYYPYLLNKSDVTANAIKGVNDVDTTEKIEVKNLPAGNYKLVVDASKIQTNKQDFAIASNKAIFNTFSSSIGLKTKMEVNNFAKVILESIY